MAELHRKSSAGVKNLRAMFETSAQRSPDSRDRSVSGNSSTTSQTTDRPLSKIRSSFVAVEKMHTVSPSASIKDRERRESFSLTQEADAEAIQEIHNVVSEEQESRRTSKDIDEVVPEQAIEIGPATPAAVATPILAAVSRKPVVHPKREEKPAASSTKPDKPHTDSKAMPSTELASKEPFPQQPLTPEPEPKQHSYNKFDTTSPPTQITTTTTTTTHPSPHTPPTHNSSAFKQVQTLPATHSLPPPTIEAQEHPPSPSPSQAAPGTVRPPSTQPNRSRTRQPSSTASTRSSLASTTTLPGSIDRGIGFTKPRPRSPTRPLKLPAHLVAPTASSAAKLKGEGGGGGGGGVAALSPRVNGIGSRASVGGESTRRARPAWGPPPTKKKEDVARRRVVPEKPTRAEVDRGFLERMMRPTASSAAKERGGGLGK